MLRYARLKHRDSHPELPLDPDAIRPGRYTWTRHLTTRLEIVVFLGGSLGAVARYSLGALLPVATDGWPTATLTVNLTGALCLGFLLEALARRGSDRGIRRLLRLGIGTGFIGAFTTYSTFAVETDLLAKGNHLKLAALYALVSIIGGVLCSGIGIWTATAHHRRHVQSARRRTGLATLPVVEKRS